ncbi:MAG: hypothetical protein GY798_33680 [Hyphomicrobiales bacterium]|nr:hypothetical protein [Hyphomicrobiales bacterium]
MANTILTPTAVTREALRVLHQKLGFIGSIHRGYDSSFAKTGAKIGNTLKIRQPNEYTVRTGATLSAQDTTESSVDLTISTQKGVDVNFTSEELTLDLDDFTDRVLEPAMAVLAATMESDALSMYKDVYNQVDNVGSAITFAKVLEGRKKLVDNLAPTSKRSVCLNTQDNVDLVDTLKGLFQDSTQVAKQYREGYVGRTGGFEFMESTFMPSHDSGSDDGTGDYLVDGASQTGATLVVDTGTGTLLQGDVITIAGVNRVHPETKADTGILQQFVVTADSGASATSLAISPSIVTSTGRQNVTGSPADNAVITKVGGASVNYGLSLAYHKDAFAFGTADLVMPDGVDFAARRAFDGISMRIVRQYDINNDKFPCRIDVLYGYKAIRPQLAARLANN